MSLINQMLNDLEKRSKLPLNPDKTLSGLHPANNFEDQQKEKSWYMLFIMIICLIAVMILFSRYLATNKKNAVPVNQSKIQPLYFNPSLQKFNNLNASKPVAAILTGITLQTQEQITYLHFLLNESPLYQVSLDKEQRKLIILLEQTRLTTSLPEINYLNSAIKHMDVINLANGHLKIILSLSPSAEIQQLELNEKGRYPELQLNIFSNAPIEAVVEKPPQKKFLVNLDVKEQYLRAMSHVNFGQVDKSIELLAHLLDQNPSYDPAAQSLINLLIKQGNVVKANEILNTALQKNPTHLPYIELKARLLVEQGNVAQALRLLESNSPAMKTNQEYYGFLAALYQQQGESDLAANLYKRLLALQPQKGAWWMGLGIALDSIGKNAEAQDAFTKAERSPELSPEVKSFLDSRMHVDA